MRTSKFIVKGMHCKSCEILINDSIEELEGIENTNSSYQKGEVVVSYDETKIDKQAIKKVIEDEGYKVE